MPLPVWPNAHDNADNLPGDIASQRPLAELSAQECISKKFLQRINLFDGIQMEVCVIQNSLNLF